MFAKCFSIWRKKSIRKYVDFEIFTFPRKTERRSKLDENLFLHFLSLSLISLDGTDSAGKSM